SRKGRLPMLQPNESAPRGARRGRLAGGTLAAALLAAAVALGACADDGPTEPARAVPHGPSLAVNPACSGPGGQVHTIDTIKVARTWTRGNNPHRVNHIIYVEGPGSLTLKPGVLVCFASGAALRFNHGGRLVANGLDTARIVLTGTNTVGSWWGMEMQGAPSVPSSLKNVVVEYTSTAYALAALDTHAVNIDSTVFRQNEAGVYLMARGSSLRRSRVDTLSNPYAAAVTLGGKTTFQNTVIRAAAGVGLSVVGTDSVSLLGGRIEGSAGVGLVLAPPATGFLSTQPVRVTGGAGYPAQMDVSAFARLYSTLADQDSLLGNARDTLLVTGGTLTAGAYAGAALPWYVTGPVTVQGSGWMQASPGATLVFNGWGGITVTGGGRLWARGSQAAPVLFTGTGWEGLDFDGTPTTPQGQNNQARSYLTNVRVEGVYGIAVLAVDPHPVEIDSAVFRQNGAGVYLLTSGAGTRLSRSRVDTTSISMFAAVDVEYGVVESTFIRGSAGIGMRLRSSGVQVVSCEVRESAAEGIVTWQPVTVHDCNLVDNVGVGIDALNLNSVDGENNWWGDAAGPTGPNGDGASALVDYTPWRTAPYVLPYVP
ncbi:MAG TPA: right-handed parallel beta-helix repeat-containing protein, partial [Longimicrobium sp.]|nr:right-handed parallel beta-helix repeat-containing protein [Longimicrobium sp.]